MNPADLFREPPATDVAWKIATTILPMGDDVTAFATVIRYLSATLVVVATIYLGYSILMAIVRAARKGEALSDQQSGAMAMVRVVVGLGCLVPIGAGGLSTVHYILRDGFVRPGINAANAAAGSAAEFILRDGHPLSPVSAGGRDVVLAVVESEVCARTYAVSRTWQVIDGAGAAAQPSPAGEEVRSPARESWFPWGTDEPERVTGYAWDWGRACGSLMLTTAAGFGDGAFGAARRQAVATVVSEVRALPFVDRLAEAARTASSTHVAGPDADAAYAGLGILRSAVDAELRAAGERYDRGLSKVAAGLSTGDDAGMRQTVLRDIEERGFYALGSYYRVMAHASLASAEAVSERAQRTAPDPAAWESMAGPVGTALALVDGQLRRESAVSALATGTELTGKAAEGGNFLATIEQSVTVPLTDYLTGYEGPRADPIGDLMSLGGILMVSAQAAWGLALAAYTASGIFGGIGGGVLDFLMIAGWPIIGGAWVVGAMLAYVVPIIPFVFMTFALVAWAWEVVKAAIAVVIWAFLHVRIDEPELVGQAQKQGYISLLVGIMLRPIVTVAAFVAMHMMNITILNIFLTGYNAAFKGSQVGYTIGGTGVLISVAVMLYVEWQIILWSYKTVTTMPQKVAEFIGYSASGWGDDDAGSSVVGAISGGHRHVPKPGSGKSGKGGGGDDAAKGATESAAKLGASAAGGPAVGAAAGAAADKV
ncbi:DotA/TraY family protein [Aureimonas pseudogalii]|uniref:Conjugal transfer/type IV secretion protein DotA/TraY n=1 Tax=Aureimonas pseudogalii TaxID=1744844 RepID=A0A7W6EBP2_9HYPH|nr:DotA/TraY family protein [Aureimonas pseudogalii]MBB3998391.1 conjugal transfer/type IV secretion protein DotA/TraY [Aureimonas pseudogalii]